MANVQRRLGALNHLPEDPFDNPRGFIDEATANGIKAFQRAMGLTDDGWLAPGGETERALEDAIVSLSRAKSLEWLPQLPSPKPWALDQVLDTERLSKAAKEACEQIKKMLEKGELDPHKDKQFLPRLLDKLTKAKPKPESEPPDRRD